MQGAARLGSTIGSTAFDDLERQRPPGGPHGSGEPLASMLRADLQRPGSAEHVMKTVAEFNGTASQT